MIKLSEMTVEEMLVVIEASTVGKDNHGWARQQWEAGLYTTENVTIQCLIARDYQF